MSRIFITGSSDGLGPMAAQLLLEQGHSVVLHARNVQRAEATRRRLPRAEAIVKGDLASLQRMGFAVDGPIVLRRISENQSRIAPMCM